MIDLERYGTKVVTNEEMSRVERLSIKEGQDEKSYVLTAGKNLFLAISAYIKKKQIHGPIYLLCGKGNNAADTYTLGGHLLDHHYEVIAWTPFDLDDCSPLCRDMGKAFHAKGGNLQHIEEASSMVFQKSGIIIDGLLGTGFKGALEGIYLHMVEKANQSNLHKIAVDIPSGVNGKDGSVQSSAFKAFLTCTLGMAKTGLFCKQGYEHAGKIIIIDFGLPEKYQKMAQPSYILVHKRSLQLPAMQRCRHKYEAGQVLAIAGSKQMSGAAGLAVHAAMRVGAGIVKLFSHPDHKESLPHIPEEVITRTWDDPILEEELKRSKSFLIGPGISRDEKTFSFLRSFLPEIKQPCVVDADALYYLSKESPKWATKELVFTPHLGELKQLLHESDEPPDLFSFVQAYVDKHECLIVLKGAPTWCFYPKMTPLIIAKGDPGMATAGSGDVLTGMIAGFMAQKMDRLSATLLAIYLHGFAGELAAQKLSSYSMIASDIIAKIPDAIKRFAHSDHDTMI
jgi:ADP-dependent NAD(P)H-hydrate dehydratase / NAD(P)H-hydrate epimerase